jgi:hypothetical protein
MPSAEMRRRHELGLHKDLHEDEEMDISAANSSAPPLDLLGIASPPAELPNPNRFELASPRASEDTSRIQSPEIPTIVRNSGNVKKEGTKNGQVKFSERPTLNDSRGRMSYDGPSRSPVNTPRLENSRRFSFSTRSRKVPMMYDGDDLEGDLGYAAAEGMEGNQRKVIVERLETVKSKNPVFTWC